MLRTLAPLCLLLSFAVTLPSATLPPEADRKLALEIYKEMVESKSGFTSGTTTPIAESVAARLKAAGFPSSDIFVGGVIPKKANVVVRYHGTPVNPGTARKPILLLAHIDVVEAKREDWSTDPFQFIEREGYYYGRGTVDDKAQASLWIANLIRYKREGFKPDRDIIVALTADEEGGGPYNGARWLARNHRDLIDAEYAINEGARGELVDGKRISNDVEISEKGFANFRFEVRNKGGHSARPVPDNAIYHLAAALDRLALFNFPFHANEVARAYFAEMSKMVTGPISADLEKASRGDADAMPRVAAASPQWNATLRTTCVATLLEGGHAVNALPQLAAANINCRPLPEDSIDYVLQTLRKVSADDQVSVTLTGEGISGSASPINAGLMKTIARFTDTQWPGVRTIPMMQVGGTDGSFLREVGIPTYGVQGLFVDRDDSRAHGRDERMPVQSFYEGQTFLYELVKALATP